MEEKVDNKGEDKQGNLEREVGEEERRQYIEKKRERSAYSKERGHSILKYMKKRNIKVY